MRSLKLVATAALIGLVCPSCVKPEEKKPVGPTSSASSMPWNVPQAGQGMGQLGMLQQTQQRR